MKIERDPSIETRWLLIDDYEPSGIIVFDMTVSDRQVAVFQDSADKALSMEFDSLQESAQFDADELVNGLILLAQMIKEEAK
ncbi:hypothetical protein [Enterococcus diestrammenae]|uniref:hypothetical protein n=1 Tax=Enterococcus diestrammenae TaxID=1155073 RepID=UPI0019595B5C